MDAAIIINKGEAIAIIRHYGNNSILGLLGHHYDTNKRWNDAQQRFEVTMPETLTVYKERGDIPEDLVYGDMEAAERMFKVGVTMRNLNISVSTDKLQSSNGIAFLF